MILLILACSGPGDPDPKHDSQATGRDSLADSSPDSAEDSGQELFTCNAVTEPEVEPTLPAVRLSSEVTWTLEFDEEAETSGLVDCTYTRTYEGLEFKDQPYLCGNCDHLVAGDAVMVEGGEDCFAQISEADGSRPEWWGIDLEGMRMYRSSTENLLGEMDLIVESDWSDGDADIGWESTYELSDGGLLTLSALGTMSWETDAETLLPDYWAPRQTDYAGGWSQDDPGTLELDYEITALGDTFPNVRLMDQCEDQVALWDLYGRWLVIDTSQYNCGPCQTMAETFPAMQEELAAEGVEVLMVTFFGNGLSDVLSSPDKATVDAWTEEFGNHGPIYYDRGFGYAVFPDFLLEATGEDFGYPAWVLVNPEMQVVHGSVGFGSWDDTAKMIREAEGL